MRQNNKRYAGVCRCGRPITHAHPDYEGHANPDHVMVRSKCCDRVTRLDHTRNDA